MTLVITYYRHNEVSFAYYVVIMKNQEKEIVNKV